MPAPILKTERLILRPWEKKDLPFFAALNADPSVMEFFPNPLSKEESDLLAHKIQEELEEKEYGLFAVEVKNGPSFIGFVGLHHQNFKAPFTPCIEIGWRIDKPYWGKGYAFEAALKVLSYAFLDLKLEEVVSFTTKTNARSRKLMEKLNMIRADDFMHPMLPDNHPLQHHVLYKIEKSAY
jgi:RimJ/RimL family protein N-acetyltransferase